MTHSLKISKDLELPLDAVTQTFAILAKRGSGKTYTALVLVEELVGAEMPVVCVDPIGVMWGLRLDRGGKGPGLPVTILGGDHGDVPLEPGAGTVIADFVIEARQPCVLDVSLMRKGEQTRFMTDFAERLYHKNRAPLHLVLDEADAFAPQKTFPEGARLLGAIEDLVRRGRARGIGVTLVTQRAAVLNKNVLTQTECLVVLRTTGPQDRKAIEDWIAYHGTDEDRGKVLASLASLPRGEAWFWSPGWLGLLKRVGVRRRHTFDSSATPEAVSGKAQTVAPRELPAGALDELRKRIASTIEKVKADDPKELRKRISELEESLRQATTRALPRVEQVEVEIPAPYIPEPLIRGVADAMTVLDATSKALARALASAEVEGARVLDADGVERLYASRKNGAPALPTDLVPVTAKSVAKAREPLIVKVPTALQMMHASEASPMPSGERKILTALAQYPGGRSKVQIAILTGYAHNGGGFNNYLSALRSKGWIEGHGEFMRVTEEGSRALGPFEGLPTGRALLEHWTAKLGKAERLVLEVLAHAYPSGLSKEDVAERTGYASDGGGFNNALSKLRTLELIEGRGELRASGALVGGA